MASTALTGNRPSAKEAAHGQHHTRQPANSLLVTPWPALPTFARASGCHRRRSAVDLCLALGSGGLRPAQLADCRAGVGCGEVRERHLGAVVPPPGRLQLRGSCRLLPWIRGGCLLPLPRQRRLALGWRSRSRGSGLQRQRARRLQLGVLLDELALR